MARARPVVVSSSCGIADWPDLLPGLYCIGDDESLAQAIVRIRNLPEATRREKPQLARQAALDLNERNVADWILRLSGDIDTGLG
jgi:hypothetical protein